MDFTKFLWLIKFSPTASVKWRKRRLKLFLTEHAYVHSAADSLPGNEQHLASLFSTPKKQIKGTLNRSVYDWNLFSFLQWRRWMWRHRFYQAHREDWRLQEPASFVYPSRTTPEPHVTIGSNVASFLRTCHLTVSSICLFSSIYFF